MMETKETTASVTRDYLEARLDAQAETITALRAYIGDTPAKIDVQAQIIEALRSHMVAVIEAHKELHRARDQHVESMFVAARDAVSAALAAADRAVSKAELASEKRFEGVNEFRSALNDNARLLMPRSETEQRITALDEKLIDLTKRQASIEERTRGKGEGWQGIAMIVSMVASLVAIGVVLTRLVI